MHKILEVLLSPPDGDDIGAFLHEAVGEGFADAGCGADDEDAFVLERHACGWEVACEIDLERLRRGREGLVGDLFRTYGSFLKLAGVF